MKNGCTFRDVEDHADLRACLAQSQPAQGFAFLGCEGVLDAPLKFVTKKLSVSEVTATGEDLSSRNETFGFDGVTVKRLISRQAHHALDTQNLVHGKAHAITQSKSTGLLKHLQAARLLEESFIPHNGIGMRVGRDSCKIRRKSAKHLI